MNQKESNILWRQAHNHKCGVCQVMVCSACRFHIFRFPNAEVKQAHADLLHKEKVQACACPGPREKRAYGR